MKPLVLLSLLFLSVFATAQTRLPARRGVVLPRDRITVTVTFSTPPASVSALFAVLKYNKDCALSIELDDNSAGMNVLFPLFDGGTDTFGNTYAPKTFTDGCGNPIPYRAGLAVNARSWYNNSPTSSGPPPTFGYDNIAAMIGRDWSLENHGYYHETTNNWTLGPNNMNLNLRANQQWWWDRMKEQNVEYVMRTMVVPSGSANYVKAADSLRYVAATSQGGTADGYTCWQFPTTESVPAGYAFYGRWLGDQWGTTAQLTSFKAQFDLLLSSSTPTAHKLWRWFAHGVVLPNIATWTDYVASTANDRVWVVGLHEYAEYHEVKKAVIKKEILTGNMLTITLDLTRVSPANRFRDMSLLIKSGGIAIQSVTVTNADRYTYNAATGLVNVFRKKTSGFAGPFTH